MTKHHEVPTHLNVEDKVVLGLTVRQFLYLLVGSSATYTIWGQTDALPTVMRVGIGTICVLLTLAFALLRLADRPLEEWLAVALVYVAAPKCAIWHPAEPEPTSWRPKGASWQELTPSVAWADEGEESR